VGCFAFDLILEILSVQQIKHVIMWQPVSKGSPAKRVSCFSNTALFENDALSLPLRFPNDQRFSSLSSSDWDPVQSKVAPAFEERGTG
jgi:hypothetical protein